MTAEPVEPLAIHGGPAVRAHPWQHAPDPPPATDPDALGALRAELAARLDLDPAAVTLAAGAAQARTAALRGAREALDAGAAGFEIALPALFAGAWLDSALAAGLAPVPAEVDADVGALAPSGLAQAASERTRLAVAAHAFGHPPPMTELLRLASTAGIAVIEDATGALGARERGHHAGTQGALGLLRLGGAHSPAPAAALITAGPRVRGALPAVAPPDEAAARAALAWLRAEPERLAARRQWAWELTFALRRMRGVATMHHGRWSRHAYDRYVLRLRALLWKRPLEDTVAALAAEGIPCAPAARAAPLFADERVAAALGAEDPRLQPARFPVTQRLAAEWIAIPVPEGGTQREIDDVVAALRKLEAASP